jgi:prevent-host-death family protein
VTSLPDELPISEARDHLTDVVGRATYSGQITYITKRGRRVGAVVPVEVAEAAEAAKDNYLSKLAHDAEAELAAGAPIRALADVVADLDIGAVEDRADDDGADEITLPGGLPRPRGESSSFAPDSGPRRRP